MIDLGHFSLVTAWLLSLYAVIVGFTGASRFKRLEQFSSALTASARNSLLLVVFFITASFACLAVAFLHHDYRYLYVWQHSNNEMASGYLVSAIWGGMDGSMLLWAWIMSIFCGCVVARSRALNRELMSFVYPVMGGGLCFFLFVVTFLTNPFCLVPPENIPTNGNGLNPLLQNPSMLIHPPCLYSGFTGFFIPFSFCLAALFSGRLTFEWIQITRRWSLIAWSFLTTGIILGGNWAYIVLGWGGFWAWDPVENASFLPWLAGTAFLHSVMVQERRGMLKVWNVSLAVLTYLLTVFGTFLTRSGVVQSVHAFAETDVGWVFLCYIGMIIVLTVGLVAYRWKQLRPEARIDSFFSREAAFLFNNLLLLSICFATFWGVMFPVLSEYFTGTKSVVGPPFYNRVNTPLFLSLIALMGVGPLIAWRRNTFKTISKLFLRPLIVGVAVTAIFLWVDSARLGAAISFGLCFFVVGAIAGEYYRGLRVRRELVSERAGVALVNLVKRRPRRYGGLLVHFGIVIMTIAITASSVYKIERDFQLKPGEEYQVGRYTLRLDLISEKQLANYNALNATLTVYETVGHKLLGSLKPERRYYEVSKETTSEVDIRMTPREDLYLALAGLDVQDNNAEVDLAKTAAIFKVFVNPLQIWLWFGGVVVLLGAFLVIGPTVRERAFEEVAAERASVKV